MNNITFIGTGYVGLVSGVIMSYLGHNVTCLDTDTHKISELTKNILPIYEPKLEQYLPPLVKSGKLKFISNYSSELQTSQVVFITVGTPSLPSGEANLQHIFLAIDQLCGWIKSDCLIVIKSTVPPTTCNQIISYLNKKNLYFPIASNPEFLREGNAVDDFLNPDRILIGTNSKFAEDLLREVYLPLTTRNIKLISTDLVTAELAKYAANSFLATKIAFTNEMANLCEQTGANIKDLTCAMGLDKRIGLDFLNAGPGFGGSCFPKDLLALSSITKKFQANGKIIDAVISSNEQRPYDMVKKIFRIISDNLQEEINFTNKTITVLGLTFKAGTDDIRYSPAIRIIQILLEKGAIIKAFDPIGMDNTKKYLENLYDNKINYKKNVFFAKTALSACKNSDIILITTEWPEFKKLAWGAINSQTDLPIIIDLRNILESDKLKSLGFKYYCLGRS